MNLHENVWQGLILDKLLFAQIALRFIFIFNVTSERSVKISRENIDQLRVQTHVRAYSSLLPWKRH